MTKIVNSDIVSAFDAEGVIGSKVTDHESFMRVVTAAVESHDFAAERVPGQGFIQVPEAATFVSAGVGKTTTDPKDYVCREHRGQVSAYLRREHAAPTEGCAVVMYTTEAYLSDPDVTEEEAARVKAAEATHVLVAVLAFAGPKSPLPPYRFVHNLAGGNKEAQVWSADEIRSKAKESLDYWNDWTTVADDPV